MQTVRILSPRLQIRSRAELERRRRGGALDNRFAHYDSAVEFGRAELGEDYTADIVEVMESVRDNPVTVARSGNSIGKTHGAARISTWFFLKYADSQVYTTAAPPEDNLKRLLWGEIDKIALDHPGIFRGCRLTNLNIGRGPRSFITGVRIPTSGTAAQREAKFSGKHAPHLLFIVDEGDAVPDEVYKGIESCMSGGYTRLLIMFNPRAERGAVYRMERDHQAYVINLSAIRHPNVITGEIKIPGAVDREKTVRRINEWTRPLVADERPDNESFRVPAGLVGSVARSLDGQTEYLPLKPGWRKVSNPAFFYMVLGVYPAQSEFQLISKAWIEAARARWDAYVAQHGETLPDVRPIMGQDVAEFGQDWNMTCFRYGGFVPRFRHFWNGLDPDATGTRAAELYYTNNAEKCNVDATGVGSSVAPKMSRTRYRCRAYSIKVASSPTIQIEEGEFYELRDQLWWLCREWLRGPEAMLPPDEGLVEELLTPTYGYAKGRIKVMSKDEMRDLLKRSPDKADALNLTFAPEPTTGKTRAI